MTAETALLPLPERTDWCDLNGDLFRESQMRDYARANLAELQREVEGLRAEVAGLTAQVEHHTAYTVIHRGALRYCNSTMRDAYSDEHHRAERLAGALEELARGEEGDSIIRKIARAALDQETTNG